MGHRHRRKNALDVRACVCVCVCVCACGARSCLSRQLTPAVSLLLVASLHGVLAVAMREACYRSSGTESSGAVFFQEPQSAHMTELNYCIVRICASCKGGSHERPQCLLAMPNQY